MAQDFSRWASPRRVFGKEPRDRSFKGKKAIGWIKTTRAIEAALWQIKGQVPNSGFCDVDYWCGDGQSTPNIILFIKKPSSGRENYHAVSSKRSKRPAPHPAEWRAYRHPSRNGLVWRERVFAAETGPFVLPSSRPTFLIEFLATRWRLSPSKGSPKALDDMARAGAGRHLGHYSTSR